MDINNVNNIYFLGIGGIGMSALARYFLWRGVAVHGYDKVCTPLTLKLEEEGMIIHYEENSKLIPDDIDLAVYTPAVPDSSQEFVFLKELNAPMLKRAEVLGLISRAIPTIAVAGTHGKTTITTILAHIFKIAEVPVSAFMGGISVNYNTNFLGAESPEWVIAEADEYDRSFLHLYPEIAIVSSADPDHLDIYGSAEELDKSFCSFIKNIQPEGGLILHKSLEKLSGLHPGQKDYALSLPAHFSMKNAVIEQGRYECEFTGPDMSFSVDFGVPGKHNLENALAAAAAALQAGISQESIQKALRTYRGVKRRFEIFSPRPDVVLVDDYAHHPRELEAAISSAREFFPGRKISGIFQPHLYSRTRDFADDFAHALDMLDQVILLDIYPARELPIEGVSSSLLLDKVKCKEKILVKDDQLLDYVNKNHFDVIMTLGAGNIDRFVEPINELLKKC